MPSVTNSAARTCGLRGLALPLLAWSLIIVCALLSLLLARRWLSVVNEQLATPWDLVWESPNLSSILLVKRHVNIYAASTYNDAPFVLTMYPPLYHYVVSLFPIDETNPFFYGRVVSLAAFVGLAVLLVLSGRSGFSRLIGLFLAVAFLGTWPVTVNSAFLKNDSLGILLAVAGMLLAARSKSGLALTVSALLWIAALATKQSFFSAGVAAAAFLAVSDRRAFGKYVLAVVVWGALGAIGASLYFGSGYWFSIFQVVRQPFEVGTGARALRGFSEPLVAALVLATAVVVCRQVYVDGLRRALQISPFSAFFVLAMLQCLLTCWKLGAGTNYLIEPMCAACLVLVESTRKAMFGAPWSKSVVLVGWGLCLGGITDLAIAHRSDYSLIDDDVRAEWTGRIREYREMVAQSGIDHPHLLNVSTHFEMFTVGLDPVFNDPLLYRVLWAYKVLAPDPLIATIRQQQYDIVVAPDEYSFPGPLQETHQRIRAALKEQYQLYASSPRLKYRFFVRKPRGH